MTLEICTRCELMFETDDMEDASESEDLFESTIPLCDCCKKLIHEEVLSDEWSMG